MSYDPPAAQNWNRTEPNLWNLQLTSTSINSLVHYCKRCHPRQHAECFRGPTGQALFRNNPTGRRGVFKNVCIDFNRKRCQRSKCRFPHQCATFGVSQIVPARSESVPQSPQIDISRQCTVNCNINVSTPSCYLAGHPDQAFVCKLINSLQFGFDIGFRGKRGSVYTRKRPSALAHPEEVRK